MPKLKILIAGISGQDGSYLAEYYNKLGHTILGLSRRNNTKLGNIKILKSDYTLKSLKRIITEVKPNIIYNLTSQSDPKTSWENSYGTINSVSSTTMHFLEIISNYSKNTKFFNASSSEIFEDTKSILNEDSKINPSNPYGCAKAFAHVLVSSYREKYKIYAVNGILFNHDSYRRSENFLCKKIIKGCLDIVNKKKKNLTLNSLSPIRDFGYAEDYIRAMTEIMLLKEPEDFIICTGKSFSVRDYAYEAFKQLGIDKKRLKNKNLNLQVKGIVRASNRKILRKTNWKPEYNLNSMITKLIIDEENYRKNGK